MKQNINTIRRLSLSRAVLREDVEVVPIPEVVIDIPLMRQVVNDMEYNVGSRPTLPSCFEESSELGVVDSFADIRVSNWDRLAQECSYSRVKQESIEVDKQPDITTEPAPTE